MQTISCSKARNFLAAAIALIATLGFAAPVFADTAAILNPDGKLTYLGTLGGANTTATGINDSGQVAGSSEMANGYYHAFITGPDGVGMRDLGTLGGSNSGATGINNTGQVTGNSDWTIFSGFGSDTFITGPNGVGMTDLNTASMDAGNSFAGGINDAGQVVGGYSTQGIQYGPSSQAFITGSNGVESTAPSTPPEASGSSAVGINNAGQVIGYYYTTGETGYPNYPEQAFITGPNGMGMTDLGTLGGAGSHSSDINNAGQVVGYSDILDGSQHAFITGPDGMGMIDLGTLGGTGSFATGINDAGQVVGYSDMADGSQHAFITGPNGVGMTDLNSLVNLPGGIFIDAANGINNHGQVIVTVAGVPEPETYALLLAGLALIGFTARLRKAA